MQPSSARQSVKRFAVLFLLAIMALSWAPRAAFAQAILRGDGIPAGEVVANDVILNGDVVRLAGTVEGNAFIAGREVIVDGRVEGSLFAVAQRITINGAVDGGAYTLGLVTQLGSEAAIGQNLYFLGVSLNSEREAQIGRDLMALSLGAQLQGSVGRNTRLTAGLVQFLNLFLDTPLGPTPAAVTALAGRAPGLGQITVGEDMTIDLIGTSTRPAQTDPETTGRQSAWDWFRYRVRDYLPLIIVGLVAYWFLRRPLEAAAAQIKARPLVTLGVGLVGLITIWATIAAFILVFVLILLVGIWLGRIDLWNVAWLFWSVAYPFSALVFALLLAFLNHGAIAIAMYAFATYLVDRFVPGAGRYRWLLLLLGLLLFVLLRAIPIMGWVLTILVTAWGIGAAWLAWRARRGPAQPVVAAAEPPPAATGAIR